MRSIVSKHPNQRSDSEWADIKYIIFESPADQDVFMPGRLTNVNFKKVFDESVLAWVIAKSGRTTFKRNFKSSHFYLDMYLPKDPMLTVSQQLDLPVDELAARDALNKFAHEIYQKGGEGVVLRDPMSSWVPKRTKSNLKVKARHDSECKIIGYIAGEAGVTGHLLGKMGAAVVQWKNKIFKLSGFTHEERTFGSAKAEEWAMNHPGETMPSWVNHTQFPIGKIVTFHYRELTNEGVPKEAAYSRPYEAV